MRAQDFLTELFEPGTAFQLEWDGEFGPAEMHATAYDRQGRTISIDFIPINEAGAVEIEFTRGGSYDLTGRGDAPQVMGTVLEAIRQYLTQYNQPPYIVFSAKEASRGSVYGKMVARLARPLGYIAAEPGDPLDLGLLPSSSQQVFMLYRQDLAPAATVDENMDHDQDHRAVPELRAALEARREKLQSATDDQVYDIIDRIMTRIARSHGMSGQKLHDMWVDQYKQVPDTWIMKEADDSDQSAPTHGAVFLGPNAVIVGQTHGKKLKLSPETVEKVKAIAAQHGAWYEGNGMDRELTAGVIDEYKGSWDDDLLSPSIKGYPFQFLYVLFSNIKENDTVEGKIGFDPDSSIFDRILDTQPSTNYFPDRKFDADTLKKFLQSVSEGPYDFVRMSQAPATKKNVTKFFTQGEQLMFPDNWTEYPYRAGRVAKSVNDLRDRFLASRKQGVYVAGGDHLLAVQEFSDQPIVENFADGRGPGRPGDSQRHGIPKGATMAQLQKAARAEGRKGQLARWQINMRRGRKK